MSEHCWFCRVVFFTTGKGEAMLAGDGDDTVKIWEKDRPKAKNVNTCRSKLLKRSQIT